MSRILRNYLISFVIIGVFFLIVHGINRCVEQRTPPDSGGPSQQQPRSG